MPKPVSAHAPREATRGSGRGPSRRPLPRPLKAALELLLRRLERPAVTPPSDPGAPHRVYILLRSVYGMGGTVRTVVNTANHLASVGYDVELITLFRTRARPAFPLDRRVKVRVIFDERALRGMDSLPPIPALKTRARGMVLVALLHPWRSLLVDPVENMHARSSVLTDLLLIRTLRRLRPGVLILTRPALNRIGARFASPKVRTIGQEHLNFPSYEPGLRAKLLESYGRLDALAVLTRGDEEDYRRALAGTPTLIRRIPNGILRLPDSVSDQSEKVIVAAGRVTRMKGFDLLIEAFAPIAAKHPDWQVRIFGKGTQEAILRQQIADLGLEGRVHLMGHTHQMMTEMARGSVFALSSRFEGLPMVIIEAMSAALPVVAFDCPRGPSDLIDPGTDGLLVPAEDVPALTSALDSVLSDDARRAAMGKAALAKAHTMTLDSVGKQWEQLIGELSPATRPRRRRR